MAYGNGTYRTIELRTKYALRNPTSISRKKMTVVVRPLANARMGRLLYVWDDVHSCPPAAAQPSRQSRYRHIAKARENFRIPDRAWAASNGRCRRQYRA